MVVGINADLNEGNLRALGLIFFEIIFVGLIYSAVIITNNPESISKWVTVIALYVVALSVFFFDLVPITSSIIKSYNVKDNYANQIRIHQELENIKLAKEIREKGKKPIIDNLYSDSVKLHLGIKIKKKSKKIPFWKKLNNSNQS